jgi:hypothetical protein
VALSQGAAARSAAREVLKLLESRFAREVAEEGLERLEGRIAVAIERHGDEVAAALRRVGPRVGLEAVERHGAAGARFLARHGDEGARLLATDGELAVRLAAAHGDEAVALLARHRGVAGPLIGAFGDDGMRALKAVSTDGAVVLRRLEPEIRASGRAKDILAGVERFGDRFCAFLWRNKGVVFGAAVLAAFLSDPEPYLDGVKRLVVEPAKETAAAAAKQTDWTIVVVSGMVIVAVAAGLKLAMRRAVRAIA